MGASFWISMGHPGPTPPHAMCGSPPLMPPHGYTHPLQPTPKSHQQGPLPLPRLISGLQFPTLAHFKALASIIFHSLASYYVLQISFQFFGPIRVSVAQWTKALIPLKAFFFSLIVIIFTEVFIYLSLLVLSVLQMYRENKPKFLVLEKCFVVV